MSKIKMPARMQPKRIKPTETKVAPPQPTEQVADKIQSLTDEDKIVLDTVLAPSVAMVLKKIAPEAGDLIDQFTGAEENVVLPVSVVKNFATKRYGGADEGDAVESFIADLSATQEMDQQPVPPEEDQYEAIDTEQI